MLINHFNLEKYPIEPKSNQRSKEESLNKRVCIKFLNTPNKRYIFATDERYEVGTDLIVLGQSYKGKPQWQIATVVALDKDNWNAIPKKELIVLDLNSLPKINKHVPTRHGKNTQIVAKRNKKLLYQNDFHDLIGFHLHNQDRLIKSKEIIPGFIGMNIIINRDEIKDNDRKICGIEIEVIDEKTVQPYDYQYKLCHEKEINIFAYFVYVHVLTEMEKLLDAGIIERYELGDYL